MPGVLVMKIRAELTPYDADAKEGHHLVVERHWNQHDTLVVLILDGRRLTVSAAQLHAAIDAVTVGGWGSR